MTRSDTIVIIGCGPAGLFAAQACKDVNIPYVVYSDKVNKSVIGGAQFVHEIPVSLSHLVQRKDVKFEFHGTREGYAEKIYGDPLADCSWDNYSRGLHKAWSMKEVYDLLWGMHWNNVAAISINGFSLVNLLNQYKKVIIAAPLFHFCTKNHAFESEGVYISKVDLVGQNIEPKIIYNGIKLPSYYRVSYLDGVMSAEVSLRSFEAMEEGAYKSEIQDEWTFIRKPLKTNCDCHPEAVRVGRMGLWDKKGLVHHAHELTLEAIKKAQEEKIDALHRM